MLKAVFLTMAALMVLTTGVFAAEVEVEIDNSKVVAAMKKVMYQEPCCGSCARLTNDEARTILRYLAGDREPAGRSLWVTYGKKILTQLESIDPAQANELRKLAAEREHANR
ncbi:MAG: hypothetical protein HY319_02175 [Armatimonadetes bacterium]|nr:hypothetical protein [Armatimonadota bacterium]